MKNNKLVSVIAGVGILAATLLSGCSSDQNNSSYDKNKVSKDDMGPLRPSSKVNRPFDYDLWHTYMRRKDDKTL